MAKSFNSPSKNVIRTDWDLPIIKFISEKLDTKLVYLGLPAPDAEDVKCWIEYIDNVIAFQCREYPKPSDPSQSRHAIDKLEENLRQYEIQGKLKNYSIYDGYIEEVILRERDISNNKYQQEEVVTLYNLDYCNSLSAPIEYIDNNGSAKQGYKFQSIKKLIDLQSKLDIHSKKFVLFLTVSSHYFEPEMDELIDSEMDANISSINRLHKSIPDDIEKKARLLRSYTINNLQLLFRTNGFIPEFLPTVKYDGLPLPRSGNPMILLHFTVIGTQMSSVAGSAPTYQSMETLIKQKFICLNKGNIIGGVDIDSLVESNVTFTPTDYISQSESYKKYWNQNEKK